MVRGDGDGDGDDDDDDDDDTVSTHHAEVLMLLNHVKRTCAACIAEAVRMWCWHSPRRLPRGDVRAHRDSRAFGDGLVGACSQ